jgi:cytoskeletal protein CcmA (bactofilin family)
MAPCVLLESFCMFNSKNPAGVPDAGASTNARSFAAHANAGDSNCSIINEWLIMRGDLESEGDILVKGKVHGNIQCKLLIIDAEAVIEGSIFADEVVIRGTTRGIVKARRVRLEKTANIDSEIFQESFSAEEGARIKGALRGYEDHVVFVAAPLPPVIEKPVGASLYHLLDQARSAQHAHLAVAQ